MQATRFLTTLIAFFLVSCDRGATTGHPGNESENPGGRSFYEMVTGNSVGDGQSGWDKLFNTSRYIYGKDPIPFLSKHINKIPKGDALVLAVGEGRNGVYLARKGFRVTGIDISDVALKKAHRLAKEYNVKINLIQGNLKFYKIPENKYDLIVNVTYFRKGLIPSIKAGLKRGGAVVFENYTVDHLKYPAGLSVPKRFLVEKGELRALFSDFQILDYQETDDGKEAKAHLLAIKP